MKKLKIEIKSWLNGSVLFEYETENNTIRKTLEEAVSKGANLWGADLRGANLRGANLQRADLRGANLQGADLWGADLWGANGLDIWWHIHHEKLWEVLVEPIRSRINYIKKEKPKEEQETRLRLLKPVLGEFPKDEKGWEKLHEEECKDCPWDGKTIFSKATP